ncbi:MAG TPA: 23S rRNA (guanosine(2251)-2'-O)-methyltransferase RlmB [bacterium]
MSEIIYGRNPVLEALRARLKFEKILLADHLDASRVAEILSLAKRAGIFVQRLPQKRLIEIAGADSQGIVGLVHPQTYAEVDDILKKGGRLQETPFLALLDGLEDPHNLGAVIRAADGAGVHGLILPKRRSVGLTGAVAKSSAGASAHVLIAQVTNLNNCIEELKEKNIWLVGADQTADKLYYEADLSGALGVVIGGEGKGLHRLVKEKCDFLVKIPMYGRVNSLNAAVAAALIFFEARRQRNA